MTRTTKTVGFTVPPKMAKRLNTLAREEQRTKSELFREMFRVYEAYRRQRESGLERTMELIREAQEEERVSPMTEKELLKETKRLARYGEHQAKKLGIKEEDIPKIIREERDKRKKAYQEANRT